MSSRPIFSWAYLLLSMGLLSSGGCIIRHGDFTVASTKIFRLSEFELEKANRKNGVDGRDVAHIICVIPTKGSASMEEAMDNALEQGNGDIMTDVVIKTWFFYVPYIYGQEGWSVKGDVVKTRKY